MGNPLRSEQDAFRFLLLTIGYFVLIVIGALIDVWVGVAVFVLLTIGIVWLVVSRRGRHESPVPEAPASSPPAEHRVLVVANEAVGSAELLEQLEAHAGGRALRVHVVAPALVSRLEQWTNDDGEARAAAQERLDHSVTALRAAGIEADGELGDESPVQAVEDALRTFHPDELVLATHPAGSASWLEQGVVEEVRERFALPLTHVVVDS